MATRFNITLPNGACFTLLYNEEQSKRSLQEDLILKPWAGYCQENWLSANHGQAYAPEHKVKRLLDRCGTFLLRDVPSDDRDTLSDFKESYRKSHEISMSDCPGHVLELLETGELNTSILNRDERRELQDFLNGNNEEGQTSTKTKKKCRETKFDRIGKLKKLCPDGRITTVSVDTENHFLYNGRRYEIDHCLKQYAPRRTRYGDQYDMDRVMVVECGDGTLFFADQDGNPIDGGYVNDLGEVN